MKCLGIAASPRAKGNTTTLLKEALSGAKAAGAKIELVDLRKLNYSGCIACGGCHEKGFCVVQDDLQNVYTRILEADRIIIAAPIYFMDINAQAKALIDRGQCFWAKKVLLKQPIITDSDSRSPRKGFFISTCGSKVPSAFQCAEKVVKHYFDFIEAEYLKGYFYHDVDAAEDIHTKPEALAEIYRAGYKLISS